MFKIKWKEVDPFLIGNFKNQHDIEIEKTKLKEIKKNGMFLIDKRNGKTIELTKEEYEKLRVEYKLTKDNKTYIKLGLLSKFAITYWDFKKYVDYEMLKNEGKFDVLSLETLKAILKGSDIHGVKVDKILKLAIDYAEGKVTLDEIESEEIKYNNKNNSLIVIDIFGERIKLEKTENNIYIYLQEIKKITKDNQDRFKKTWKKRRIKVMDNEKECLNLAITLEDFIKALKRGKVFFKRHVSEAEIKDVIKKLRKVQREAVKQNGCE